MIKTPEPLTGAISPLKTVIEGTCSKQTSEASHINERRRSTYFSVGSGNEYKTCSQKRIKRRLMEIPAHCRFHVRLHSPIMQGCEGICRRLRIIARCTNYNFFFSRN